MNKYGFKPLGVRFTGNPETLKPQVSLSVVHKKKVFVKYHKPDHHNLLRPSASVRVKATNLTVTFITTSAHDRRSFVPEIQKDFSDWLEVCCSWLTVCSDAGSRSGLGREQALELELE